MLRRKVTLRGYPNAAQQAVLGGFLKLLRLL